ncbi:MAG: hypothetical protein GXO94_08895 [Nitrospirae bacterium]|nr:hypothetical protein [Nitrospirota bacterium]
MKPESRKVFLETRARIIERARKESRSKSKSLRDMLFGCKPGNIKYYNIRKIEGRKDPDAEPSGEEPGGE